jgi:hypothetical protein
MTSTFCVSEPGFVGHPEPDAAVELGHVARIRLPEDIDQPAEAVHDRADPIFGHACGRRRGQSRGGRGGGTYRRCLADPGMTAPARAVTHPSVGERRGWR